MEKRNLYILIAVILVAGLVLSFSGLTGESIKNVNPNLGQCVDNDGADNPDIPGTVSYTVSKAVYKDECYAEGLGPKKYIKERFCVDTMETSRYLCYNGCSENSKGEGYCNKGGYNQLIAE